MVVSMQTDESLLALKTGYIQPSAVALGYFDGVHTAHRAVINEAVKCKSEGLMPTVFTFWGGKSTATVLTKEQKLEQLKGLLVERVVMPSFSELQNVEATDFFERYIVSACNAKVVSCGYDYRFGADARGDISLLKSLCDRHGIRLVVTKKLLQGEELISSTVVKELIKKGEVETANRLLGYEYYTQGIVKSGNAVGRGFGFPTINQELQEGLIIPMLGVYATTAWIDGTPHKSITNIGLAPTIGQKEKPVIETNILAFNGDLYGKDIKITYHRMLREEKRFSSIDELKAQIEEDIKAR